MARPREFDEATVLHAAMQRFWVQGYQSTSVRDLADRMGITGASLYNAFGDKRSLYRRALDHYLQISVHDRIQRLEHLAPYRAIRGFFDEILERSLKDPQHSGCMLVNSALEMAPHDPEFRKIICKELIYIETFFRQRIEAGQRDGTITTSQPAPHLAKLLLSVLLGVRVLARTRPQRSVLDAAVTSGLRLLRTAG